MRIGTLGTARITAAALLDPAGALDDVEVAAVASRDPRRAEAFAAAHGIDRVFGTYQDLVEDDSLDAVYIPLPASMHAEWSIRAVQAGRHVLVEKPFAMNAAQASIMVDAAQQSGRLLVEAFHWRYHPLADRMIQVASLLGPLVQAEAVFYTRIPSGDIRYDPALGGGSTMDLGCYPVHWLRTLTGEEPVVIAATAIERPKGIDASLQASLSFPSGLEAVVRSSMEATSEHPEWWLRLEGRDGSMRVDNPLAPHLGHRLTADLADGTHLDEQLSLRPTYTYQLEAFRACTTGQAVPLTGGADAVANMATIDAMYRAAGLHPR